MAHLLGQILATANVNKAPWSRTQQALSLKSEFSQSIASNFAFDRNRTYYGAEGCTAQEPASIRVLLSVCRISLKVVSRFNDLLHSSTPPSATFHPRRCRYGRQPCLRTVIPISLTDSIIPYHTLVATPTRAPSPTCVTLDTIPSLVTNPKAP
jgi:hypothetical protein